MFGVATPLHDLWGWGEVSILVLTFGGMMVSFFLKDLPAGQVCASTAIDNVEDLGEARRAKGQARRHSLHFFAEKSDIYVLLM